MRYSETGLLWLAIALVSFFTAVATSMCTAHGDEGRDCDKVHIQTLRVEKTEGLHATIRVEADVDGRWNQFFVVLIFDDYGLQRALAREDLEPGEDLSIRIAFPEGTELFPAKDVYDLYAYFVSIDEHRRDSCSMLVEVRLGGEE